MTLQSKIAKKSGQNERIASEEDILERIITDFSLSKRCLANTTIQYDSYF